LHTALAHWNSSGKNGEYLLRLEVGRTDKSLLCEDEVPIRLGNTGIELFSFGATPAQLPAEGTVVKDSAGNYRQCDTFVASEQIKVFGNFRDDYFRNYCLTVFGGNIAVSGVNIGSS
jgi:hypothetical protein